MNDVVRERSVEGCYVRAKYRQARDEAGNLLLASIEEEEKMLEGLPLVDVTKK